jgi:transcriptional regulator with XRE-family HTH domain
MGTRANANSLSASWEEMDPAVRLALAKRAFATRLAQAVGARTYRQIARDTGLNHESVRRWLTGGSESIPASFIIGLAHAYRISPSWLIFGIGTADGNCCSNKTLGECTVSELFLEMAERARQQPEKPDSFVVEPKNLRRLRAIVMPPAKLRYQS